VRYTREGERYGGSDRNCDSIKKKKKVGKCLLVRKGVERERERGN
jgi:hypothetical protein